MVELSTIIEETELCKIAYKYGTDKCPKIKHVYTPFYYELFKNKKKSVKKVLELGIGYYETMKHVEKIYDKGLKRIYHKGASLKMWRDFFPNAQVYGIDIASDAMFEDERIQTFIVNERNNEQMETLIETIGSDIDIVIDDASHRSKDQIYACKTLMPLLKKDVIYIIEDVDFSKSVTTALEEYDCEVPHLPNRICFDGKLIVVKNKK